MCVYAVCVQVPTEARGGHQIELVLQDSYELPDGALGTDCSSLEEQEMVLPVEQSSQETLHNQNQKYFSFFTIITT